MSIFWKIIIPSHLVIKPKSRNMRIFFIASFLLLLYACDNNLSTIGDDLISTENFIEVKRFVMEETSTIRLDSFPTSNVSSSSVSPLVMGKITDNLTGSIATIPYFQVAPQGFVSSITWENNCEFDSLTLTIPYLKTLAGDSTAFQTFELYRTKDKKYIQFDPYNPILCNIDSLQLGEKLATLTLYPQKDNIAQAYFKLNYDFGKTLFDLMRSRDPILEQINYPQFMEDFGALAIVPGKDNSLLMNIDPSNLKLKFHYHIGAVEGEDMTTYTWPCASGQNTNTLVNNTYAFTHINYDPTTKFEDITFKESKPFDDLKMAVIEGLNGFMTKIKVPFVADAAAYQTIMKAEIELRVNTDLQENNIPEPKNLGVYIITKDNYIKGLLTDMSGQNVIYGTLSQNSVDPNSKSYIIDITDYYVNLVEGGNPIVPEIYLLVGLPGSYYGLSDAPSYQIFTGNVANTLQRVILKEEPILSIYYSHYK